MMCANKKLILFDLNGTLSCTSRVRYSSGIKLRPHTEYLDKLFECERFEIGIFSSAMKHNVEKIVNEIYKKIKYKFHYILHRDHTILSPSIDKPYNTKKPLKQNFPEFDINNIILVDDSTHKSLDDELKNLWNIPTWNGDKNDKIIKKIVKKLLKQVK